MDCSTGALRLFTENMHLIDRRLLQLWVFVTVGAGCAIYFGALVVLLMITIIGIPLALLLLQMPGIWLYLSAALAIYVGVRIFFRDASRALLLGVSLLPPLAVGFFVPWWANRITEQRVAALIVQDHGTPPTLPRGLSIAYFTDQGLGSTDNCSDMCQRLLFSRMAASFVELPLDQLSRRAALLVPVHRFSLGPVDGNCNNERLVATYASEQEAGGSRPPPRLWDKLPELAAKGLCIHDNSVRNVSVDLMVIEQLNLEPVDRQFSLYGTGWQLSLHPIAPFQRREVFRHTPKGWTRLMRRTEVKYATLKSPLWLVPAFSFTTSSPTHWARSDQRVAGESRKVYRPTHWNGVIANDLTVTGLQPAPGG